MIALLLAAAAHFDAPLRPWTSADRRVALLRPPIARPTEDATPLGSLMAPGWRLIWDGTAPTPGRIVVRLALPVVPRDGPGTAVEILQVGVGPGSRDCQRHGLAGGSARRLADRRIGSVRYAAWSNGDAGMSQQISATDLRAVVAGRCYAVARFAYATRAADRDPAVTLPQAQGAALLDQALASLRIGDPAVPPRAPALRLPPHAVAR